MVDPVKKLIEPLSKPTAEFLSYDPRYPEVASRVAQMVTSYAPDVGVEHIGSTAIPECTGKGIVNLAALYGEGRLQSRIDLLLALGFQRQNPAEFKHAWPDTRPMLLGTCIYEGTKFPVYIHVVFKGSYEAKRFLIFRDRLRSDVALLRQYVAEKEGIIRSGITDSDQYAKAI